MTKKKNSIEAFRFIFMLMICIWHYKSTEYMAHGYMAVEFFFILSGLLMYFSVSKPNALGVFDYTLRKMKRFAPDCLFLMAFVYLRHMIVPALLGRRSFDFSWTLQALPESLFLQNTGVYLGGANFPMWYMSVLLYGGALVYALLKYNKRLALSVIFPITILLGYTFIFSMNKRGRIDSFDLYGCMYVPMLRGICDMCLGVVLGYVLDKRQSLIRQIRPWVIDLLGLFALVLFLVFAFMQSKDCYDRYLLIVVPVVLLACWQKNSLFNRAFKSSVWASLGSISFQMLVYHGYIVIPFYLSLKEVLVVNLPIWLDVFLFSVVCILTCWILKKAVYRIKPIVSSILIIKKK